MLEKYFIGRLQFDKDALAERLGPQNAERLARLPQASVVRRVLTLDREPVMVTTFEGRVGSVVLLLPVVDTGTTSEQEQQYRAWQTFRAEMQRQGVLQEDPQVAL